MDGTTWWQYLPGTRSTGNGHSLSTCSWILLSPKPHNTRMPRYLPNLVTGHVNGVNTTNYLAPTGLIRGLGSDHTPDSSQYWYLLSLGEKWASLVGELSNWPYNSRLASRLPSCPDGCPTHIGRISSKGLPGTTWGGSHSPGETLEIPAQQRCYFASPSFRLVTHTKMAATNISIHATFPIHVHIHASTVSVFSPSYTTVNCQVTYFIAT